MSNGYQHAIKTKLLATNCCVCGRPLCDAESVERGMGGDCSLEGYGNGSISEEIREAANLATHDAAVAAQKGDIATVKHLADLVASYGLTRLSELMMKRFKNAWRLAKVHIEEKDGFLFVRTPFKRSKKAEFTAAWRAIPGRSFIYNRNHEGVNVVPVTEKAAVWALLKEFFDGEYGIGPKGTFKVVS